VRLSVHHWLPANLGGTDDMSNLVTLCSRCHPINEKAARTLTLPIETPAAPKAKRKNPHRHPAPYRGPNGPPWSRHWFDY
jgi:HNH endonuclease